MPRRLALFLVLLGCTPAAGTDGGIDGGPDAPAIDAPPDPCDEVTEARVETIALLSRGRYSPAVALLPDGGILVAGGYDFALGMARTSEIVDPVARTVVPAASLSVGRNFASTTTNAIGEIYVVGGFDDSTGSVTTIERWDPVASTFVTAWSFLAEGREAHTATLLPDGRILFAGGLQARGLRFVSTLELYEPFGDTIETVATESPRGFHAAAWIESRRSVLLVGGDSGSGELSSAVRWELDGGAIVPVGSRARAGKAIDAVTLGDGRVLVTGGANATDGTLSDADLYDPTADAFAPAPPMVVRRMAHTLTALGDGRVVAIGGWSDDETSPDGSGPMATGSVEVRSVGGTWTRLPVDLAVPRLDHRTVAIDHCHVVVLGGQYAASSSPPSAPVEIELVTIP